MRPDHGDDARAGWRRAGTVWRDHEHRRRAVGPAVRGRGRAARHVRPLFSGRCGRVRSCCRPQKLGAPPWRRGARIHDGGADGAVQHDHVPRAVRTRASSGGGACSIVDSCCWCWPLVRGGCGHHGLPRVCVHRVQRQTTTWERVECAPHRWRPRAVDGCPGGHRDGCDGPPRDACSLQAYRRPHAAQAPGQNRVCAHGGLGDSVAR